MLNVHTRVIDAPIAAVRPWFDELWSNSPRDVLPRGMRGWRDHAGPMVAGKTLVGHGPFTFRLVSWDGQRMRLEVVGGLGARGWHGFELIEDGARTRVTHTLALDRILGGWLGKRLLGPVHDRAVERIFDNLEAALRTGDVPRQSRSLKSDGLVMAER